MPGRVVQPAHDDVKMPERASARPRKGRLRNLDFLLLPFPANDGISRNLGTFTVSRPWALARFARVSLKPGWWQFECECEDASTAIELRLSSPADPLVSLRAAHSGAAAIYLRGDTEYDLSLLVSAWPGQTTFRKLIFRALSRPEATRLTFAEATKVVSKKRSLASLVTAAQRFMSGQSIGVRMTAANSPMPPSSATPDQPRYEDRNASRRLVKAGGLEILIDARDSIHPRALDIVAAEFARRPQLVAIYSDVEEGGRIVPHPCWDLELARWFPYPDAPFFFRAGAGRLDPDPTTRLTELVSRFGPGAIDRIALPLVRRDRTIESPFAIPRAPKLGKTPRVSAIIPTKYRTDLLELCLEGLRRHTAYPDLEVIVVDNGSTDARLKHVLKDNARELDLHRIVDSGSFNFSRLVNCGAAQATGEILLLLNDDVAALEQGWLHRLVESATRQSIGAVGARLIYPDRTIQHAGVVLGIGGVCGHLWKGAPEAAAALNPYISLPGSRSAVTAACLAIRREAFERVSGFDEQFAVALNDIDFCLRLRTAGYRNIYRGDVVLTHFESQSRGQDTASIESRRRLIRETQLFLDRWSAHIGDDPYSSPAFDPTSEKGDVHPAAWSRAPYQTI